MDAARTTLPFAVRGFFDNGGTFAYVVPVTDAEDSDAVDAALGLLTRRPDVSLVCLPGVVDPAVQGRVLAHCERPG